MKHFKNNKKAKRLYRLDGVALDQETVIRLRPKIESYVKDDLGISFKTSSMRWEMLENSSFKFHIDFYG
jgi:hypothetical protein